MQSIINCIPKDPQSALTYVSKYFKNKRCVEAEKYIVKDAMTSYYYALRHINGRWQEAEPKISESPMASYYYAIAIIGRWPEAEKTISKNEDCMIDYILNFFYDQAKNLNLRDPKVLESFKKEYMPNAL